MKKTLSAISLVAAGQVSASTLVVLNKSDATASLINLTTQEIKAVVKTGLGPHEVAVSADGRTAVVANYGDDSNPGHSLTLIDIVKAEVVGEVDLGEYTRPHGISFTSEKDQVMVTAEDHKKVLKVDLKKKQIIQAISTDQNISHLMVFDLYSNKVFVSNIGSQAVSVLDLVTGKKIIDIVTGKEPEGIDFNNALQEVWVANRSANTLVVIDSRTFKIKQELQTGEFPIRVKFTPDQKSALVTNAKSGNLSIYDVNSRLLVKTIHFPKGNMDTAGKMFGDQFKNSSVPIGMAIDSIQNRAFIAHASLDEVSVLDLNNFELKGSLKAGREPDGMAVSNL
jgi:YVTN family beta-propeller protein